MEYITKLVCGDCFSHDVKVRSYTDINDVHKNKPMKETMLKSTEKFLKDENIFFCQGCEGDPEYVTEVKIIKENINMLEFLRDKTEGE